MFLSKSKYSTQTGFTLVEILVVVALISMLGSFGGIAVRGAVAKVKDASATKMTDELARAIQLYGSVNENLINWGTDTFNGTTTNANGNTKSTGVANAKSLQDALVQSAGASFTFPQPQDRSVCYYQDVNNKIAYLVAINLSKEPAITSHTTDVTLDPSKINLIAAYGSSAYGEATDSEPTACETSKASKPEIDCANDDSTTKAEGTFTYCLEVDMSTNI